MKSKKTFEQQIDPELMQEFETELKKSESIKIDFSKNLSSIQSESYNKFWEIFLNEKLPEGQINQKLEKNFAIYIVQNKLDINQIKEKYQAQGWAINALLGWIKKVNAGDITEINIGEIINWCKENRPDLIEMFGDLKLLNETEVLRRADLIFPTFHLPMFNQIDAISQIVGKEYTHLKKLLHYHFISGMIPENLLIVKRGQIEIDLRDYLFLVYATGSSKGNVKNIALKIKRNLGQEAIALTSYHEEQLVGKVVNRGTKKKPNWIVNKGHFDSDEILIDECKPLLLERDRETSRNFLLIAMDKYQQNEIYKRLTENLNNPDEVLRYFPKFNAIFGTQPFKFPEDNIALNGFLKRVTTDYLPPLDRPDSYFDFRIDDQRPISKFYDEFLIFLKSIKYIQNKPEWTFADGFDEKFKECYKLLRYAGLYNSRKKRNYTRLIEWQLQDRLLRKTCLLAIGKDKTTHLTPEHIELAFLDLLEDFVIELEFVNDKVYGDLDYGSVWGTTNYKEKQLLQLLFNSGAISETESTFTIKDFQEKIQDVYKVGIDQARKIYYKMIESGLINSKRVKEHSSMVWIVNPPEEKASDTSGKSGNGVKRIYFELIDKYFPSDTSDTALGVKND